MTKEEILKRVKKFQGANREFSQGLPPIIEGLVDLIDEAGPEVVNNLTSNSPTKALSANMGKELKLMVDGKVSEPETAGTAGQILQLDEEGVPEWVDAAEVGATYDSTVSDTSTNAIQNKTIKKYVDDNFAQKDGYYGSLTAGAAENLVGRGSVPAEIAFRTSGGDQDLGTGSALITKILGRTEAFNQLVETDSITSQGSEITATDNGDGSFTLNGTTTAVDYIKISLQNAIDFIGGNKYLLKSSEDTSKTFLQVPSGVTSNFTEGIRTAAGSESKSVIWIGIVPDVTLTNFVVKPQIFDLTLMFGAGKEPATVAAFEALHPLPYYNYNAGVLKNNAATGIKTTGFNQWDEEYEVDAQNRVRSKNYIKVIGGSTYYMKMPNTGAAIDFYDANYNSVSTIYGVLNNNVTVPSGASYIKFVCGAGYGTTYNHDICINLSWSGYRNGEYEPYEEHILNLPLDAIPCHDENNNAVVVNGLDGVGTSYDEAVVENGMVTKIVKRFAEVDLGDLTYEIQSGYTDVFWAGISGITGTDAGICPKYVFKADGGILADKEFLFANGRIYIKDSAYSDKDVFKAALDGVKLRYELATPLTLTVDEPFAASYYVNDFGTEARLPQDTADDPQAPFCAEIQYAMNSVDTLRNLPRNYISDNSMENILNALKTAGIIADFTLTYDSEHQYFTCSVTAPSQGE